MANRNARRLRRRQPAGHRFRRQAPTGRYVVDFVCFGAGLIVDGALRQLRIDRCPRHLTTM